MPVSTGIEKHNGRITELNGKKICFPDVKEFDWLFSSAKRYTPGPGRKSHYSVNLPCGKGRFRLGDYLRIDYTGTYGFFSVQPTKPVKDFFKKVCLRVENDVMGFTINVWPSGQALVCLEHGLILGSHYLAVIDSNTLPVRDEE